MTTPEPPSREAMITEAHEIATRIGRSVGRDFSEYLEAGDLTGDLMLWSFDHEEKVREYLTPTEEDPTCKEGRRKLHTTFRRKARAWAHKAKADRLGYDVRDLHFYSLALLEELLPLAFDYEEWLPAVTVKEGSTTKTDPALGNNKAALLADVKIAYEGGTDDDKALLSVRYVSQPTASLDELAEEHGVSRTTMGRKVDRALARMLDRLGGSRPDFAGTEGRTAISNAEAQSLTHRQVEG